MNTVVTQAVINWLSSVVVGLNLCPFSGKPLRENRVRFQVSSAIDEEFLLADLSEELKLLDNTAVSEIETTLLIVPNLLQDFFNYNHFLGWADAHIKRNGWKGTYQLASFHPHYCFAGAEVDAVENLTNRSPYPILHIIREESLAAAIDFFDDVEGIPERNKKRIGGLTEEEKYILFPYLFRSS